MKKLLPLLCAMGLLAQPAFAANNITTLQNLGQADFNALSEDLSSALSYKAVAPAAPLGITGFDLGLELTETNMAKSSQLWSNITGGGSSISNLVIPKVHFTKGLPLGIDIGISYAKVPNSNISLIGGELKYAILDGGMTTPAVAIRGAFSKLGGVDQLSFNTKSLDISVSKGFLMFTPYAGVGKVWASSTANVASVAPGFTGLALSDSFSQNKIFAGFNLNLGLANFALEADKTGSARSITGKFGFRW